MRTESPSQIGAVFAMGLQILGLLGTSHGLDFLVRLAPGYATSRIAQAHFLALDAGSCGEGLVLILLRDGIGAAIAEELLFRGLVFEGLRRTLGVGAAIVGSAAFFGLAHLDVHQGLAATLLGLQLGALRAAFGLPLAIAAHAINNAASLTANLLGLEASAGSLALALLLSGAACAALVQRLDLSEPAPEAAGDERDSLQTGPRSDD